MSLAGVRVVVVVAAAWTVGLFCLFGFSVDEENSQADESKYRCTTDRSANNSTDRRRFIRRSIRRSGRARRCATAFARRGLGTRH